MNFSDRSCRSASRSNLVEWLEGETLFSLCSRYHILSQARTTRETCMDLFGHPSISAYGDFPARLDFFHVRTRGELGTPIHIVYEHSILPFFLSVQSESYCESTIAEAIRDLHASPRAWRFMRGINDTRFGRIPIYKACRVCMVRDMHCFGVPFWHVEHQIPGVWACTEHRTHLIAVAPKVTLLKCADWRLPETFELTYRPTRDLRFSASHFRFFEICTSYYRCCQAGGGFDFFVVGQVLKRRVCEFGFSDNSFDEALTHFESATSALKEIPELFPVLLTMRTRRAIFGWIAGAPAMPANPIIFLSVVFWLFSSWSDFERELQLAPVEPR